MKHRLLSHSALLLVLSFAQIQMSNAQMVGSNAYIKGTSVEIGLDGAGGFEGCNTTVSAPLAGMHYRSSTSYFGFVANPQVNAWASFDGDFFTPGTPENGWGVKLGTVGTTYGNNCNALNQIPGALSSWNHTFNCYTSDWEGNLTSGTDLHFKVNYFLQETDLYYTTTVSITNNTAATIPDMYYYRNLDPDNNVQLSGSYTTTNTIENQPFTGTCNIAHVSATQTAPWNSYLGLAAIGTNWRAGYGGFSNRDASAMWTGTGFTQTVGSVNTADEAIYIAYRIQNLAPGATETFKFVVILSAAQAANAINNLLYLSYPGSAGAPPPVCTPYTDTVRTCSGVPAPIAIQGSIVNDFNWSWSPTTGLSSSTGPSITAAPTATTTYTLTGTPISPCVTPVTMTFVVKVSPPVTAIVPANITTCPGATVPASTFTSSPAGATYAWTNSNPAIGLAASGTGSQPSFTAVNPGTTPITATISVTPTIPGGCSGPPSTYTITVNPPMTIAVNSTTICPSQTATLTATGATSYVWNTGSTANPLSVSPAVTTSYTVTGTTGSCSGTAVATVTIGGTATVLVNSPTICAGETTSLTASGASTYTWNTGSTANPLTVTPAATTSYTVTGVNGGCTGTAVATVTVNPIPVANVPANITVCNGGAVAASGFTSTPAGATFAWTNSNTSIGIAASGTGDIAGFTAVNSGTTPVTATISVVPTLAGCTGVAVTYTITVNPTPNVTVPTNITICNGDNIAATTFGSGVAGTTFSWTNSNTAIGLAASGSGNIAAFNGTNSTGAAITATITVTPTAGTCAGTAQSYTITVNPTPTTTVPANITICNGGSIPATAFASTPAGGSFAWTNSDPSIGIGASGSDNIPAFTATNTGSTAVTATITVTPSANGCTGTPNTYTITVNPTPAAPTAPGTSICINTAATLTATAPGGTYNWYDAATGGALLMTGATYVTPNLSTSTNYYVQATSAAGCVSAMTTVPVTIAPGLTVNAGMDDTICFGGSANLNVTPNGAGYTYSWTPAATLSDGTIYNPSASPAGTTTYTVTVTDPGGCVGSDAVTIFADPQITLAVAGLPTTCYGTCDGQTIVIPSGGSGAYPGYAWSGGCTTPACTQCAGSYTVTVTDSWGCTATNSATVTEPTLLTEAISASVPVSCFGLCDGSATASGNGGTGPYTFAWSTVPAQTTATATGLCAGTYTCTVTDAHNCTAIDSVTITQPTQVTIDPIANATICNSGSTVLTASATGGNGPGYSYSWTATAGLSDPAAASTTATPATTTTYTVNATDVNGCPALTQTVTVTVNLALSASTSTPAPVCPGSTANITATAINGNGGPYTYAWSPATGLSNASIASPDATPAATTTYTVTVTDGCSPASTATVTVTVLPLPVPIFNADLTSGCAPLCVKFTDASSIGSGTVNGWDWVISDGTLASGQTQTHCFINPGAYDVTLTATSADGCVSTVTYSNYITVHPNPVAQFSAPASTSILNPLVVYTDQSSVSTGSIAAWNWTFGDAQNNTSTLQNPSHTFNDVGTYCAHLLVTSNYGCQDSTDVCVIIDPEFTFFIPNAFSPNGDGINDEFYGKGDFINDYEMSIYDRWGNLIFFTDSIDKHWDGTANHGSEVAQMDTYVYVVKLTDNKDKKHKYMGSVTLVK